MSTATAVRTFAIDKTHSEAAFSVRHLITKVRGRFTDFSGAIEFNAVAPQRRPRFEKLVRMAGAPATMPSK